MRHLSKKELHRYVDEEMDEVDDSVLDLCPSNLLMQKLQRLMFHKLIDAEFPNGLTLTEQNDDKRTIH